MKKTFFKKKVTVVFLLFSVAIFAQKQISGKVSSSSSETLPGVSVVVKGTLNGVSTDFDGNYVITSVSEGAILAFSYLGYKKKEVVVGKQTTINIVLEDDVSALDEIVVVGYGTQKKVNLTGSISAVGSKKLANRAASNVSSILSGQAPGLTVLQRGGNPGKNEGSLNIRGIGTLNNSTPLIIVDGIETGSITEINPEDIANVSILKDASSAAIYGIRAANGVVLITTKRGRKGSKFTVKYSQQIGFTDFISLPKKVSSFHLATLHNEASTNDGSTLKFTASDLQKFKEGSSPLTHANTDHLKTLFSEPGLWNAHNLSLSGGTEKGAFNLSFGYVSEGGIIQNTGLEKYTFRANFDRELSDKLNVGLNLNAAFSDVKEPGAGIGWVTHTAFREWANDVQQFSDGRWADPVWSDLRHNVSAYASDSMGETRFRNLRLGATSFAEYEIIEGLKAKGQISILADKNKQSNTLLGVDLFRIDTNTGVISDVVDATTDITNLQRGNTNVRKVTREYFDKFDLNIQLLLNYEKTFGKHFVKGLLGYDQRKVVNEISTLSRRGLLSDDLDQINGGLEDTSRAFGSTIDFRSRSAFGRVNYVFDEKYLFEANLRYDGTSRFAKNQRFDYFPSFSAGWRISKEDFFNSELISELKLRGSWGKLGNQEIADYRFLSTFVSGSSYIFNGTLVSGISEGGLANPVIAWETSTSSNFGIDLGLLSNKLTLTGEYFIKDTDGILLSLPKLATLGAASPIENIAGVKNTGYEISASYKNRVGKLSYYVGANIGQVRNEITALSISEQPGRSVGDPVNNIFGYVADGYFNTQAEVAAHADQSGLGNTPVPGDIKYVDINNDGIVDAKDRQNLGDAFPAINYGFSFGANYKAFDFSTVWQGVADVETQIKGKNQRPFWFSASPVEQQLDRWTPTNQKARFPRSSFSNASNYVSSSHWIESAAYLKLRNVQLGYSLPSEILEKFGLTKLRFFISGENLLTITSFKGFDPEDVTTGNIDATYFEGDNVSDNYPTTKRFLFGLNLTF